MCTRPDQVNSPERVDDGIERAAHESYALLGLMGILAGRGPGFRRGGGREGRNPTHDSTAIDSWRDLGACSPTCPAQSMSADDSAPHRGGTAVAGGASPVRIVAGTTLARAAHALQGRGLGVEPTRGAVSARVSQRAGEPRGRAHASASVTNGMLARSSHESSRALYAERKVITEVACQFQAQCHLHPVRESI